MCCAAVVPEEPVETWQKTKGTIGSFYADDMIDAACVRERRKIVKKRRICRECFIERELLQI